MNQQQRPSSGPQPRGWEPLLCGIKAVPNHHIDCYETVNAIIRGQWNINEKAWWHIDFVIRMNMFHVLHVPPSAVSDRNVCFLCTHYCLCLLCLWNSCEPAAEMSPTADGTEDSAVVSPLLRLCRGILRHYGYWLKSRGCWGVSGSLHTSPYKSLVGPPILSHDH